MTFSVLQNFHGITTMYRIYREWSTKLKISSGQLLILELEIQNNPENLRKYVCKFSLFVLIFNTVALLPLYCGFARIQTSFTHKKLCGTESENTSSSDVVYFAI